MQEKEKKMKKGNILLITWLIEKDAIAFTGLQFFRAKLNEFIIWKYVRRMEI